MGKKIAFLTAGGIAPCLSASIGALIERYKDLAPDAQLIGYLNGYQGLLTGRSIEFSQEVWDNHHVLYNYGGSAIGNSRVKLTNVKDCVERGFVKKGEKPLHVAAEQLQKDKIDILHTIGGDDTNTTAADLANYLEENDYGLTVVGMPKTVDNDVFPIRQTLGAWTAAEQGSLFFQNVANENTTASRQLIIHEVMGRNCGWLAAATALEYHQELDNFEWLPELLISRDRWDVDGIWLPEMSLDLKAECDRLRRRLDETDKVHLFISEGAGVPTIVKEKEAAGEEVPRDAFGHVQIDKLNPGEWFAKQLQCRLDTGKILVQKSGYFGRSARPNQRDLELIKRCAFAAAEHAIDGRSGVAGEDEDDHNKMACIDFKRIKGGKPFNIDEHWFEQLLKQIGQPKGEKIDPHKEL